MAIDEDNSDEEDISQQR